MNRHQRRTLAALKRNSGTLGHRIKREVDRLVGKSDNVEYVDALEQENAALRERVAKFEREMVPLLELAPRIPKIRALEEEVAHLRYQVELLQGVRVDLTELPDDLVGVIDLIEGLYGDRIVFAPEARRSAETASFEDLRTAWRVLRLMAVVLPELYSGRGVDIEREFRARTGFELALSESRATRRDHQLQRTRRIEVGGKVFEIGAHVKVGVREPRLLRIHYAVHCGIILVGHCGDHLETAGTRRMR